MRVGHNAVLVGEVVAEVGINWMAVHCVLLVAICCVGVGVVGLAVVLCCARAVASRRPMVLILVIPFS